MRPSLSFGKPSGSTHEFSTPRTAVGHCQQALHAVEGVEAAFDHQPLLSDGVHRYHLLPGEVAHQSKQWEPRNHTGELAPAQFSHCVGTVITSSMLIWPRRMHPVSGFSSSALMRITAGSQRLWKSTPTSRSRCCAISTISSHSRTEVASGFSASTC